MWTLNPQSEFPLHATACSQAKAQMFKEALEHGFRLPRNAEAAVQGLMATHPDVRFPEVETFIAGVEDLFDEAVAKPPARNEEKMAGTEDGDGGQGFRLGAKYPQHYDDLRRLGGEMFRYIARIKSVDPLVQRCLRAELLSITYSLGAYAAHRSRQRAGMKVLGWRFLSMPAGCCADCRRVPEQNPPAPRLVVPRHVACACSVFPILH